MNDLISRQAAIDHLKKRLYETALNNNTEHPYYEEIADNRVDIWLNELPSAQPEKRTEERTETHACDLISRQAAIDALYDWSEHSMTDAEAWHIRQVIGDIKSMPSAQPEPHWIPCSERMPEPRKAVLGYAPRYQNIYALYYDSAYGWMIWNPLRDDCFPNSQGEIVAWMPLPEVYREGAQE